MKSVTKSRGEEFSKLLRNPNVLILDEATNSLDKDTQEKVIDNLRAISKKITIILITHEKIIEKKEDNIITFN